MDKPVEFRRRGRGYDINDVNDFISRENIRFNKLEEDYNKRIRDLESNIDQLNAQIEENENDKTKIVSLEIEKTELKDKISSLEAVISEKDVIIDGLKSAVDSANTKLDIANSIIEDLKNKPTPPQSVPVINTRTAYDDAIIEKANKYDSICNNIDEILAFGLSGNSDISFLYISMLNVG